MVDLTAHGSDTSTTRCPSLRPYQVRGWQVIKGWLSSAEVQRLADEADRLAKDVQLFELRGAVRASDTRTDRLDPVIDVSSIYYTLAFGRRQLNLASLALGAEALLMKDKIIYKPPKANGYAAHQDFAYWQGLGYAPNDFVTICLCIDAMTASSGAVEFARGANWTLLTPPGEIRDPTEQVLGAFETCCAQAGDAIIFSSLVPHRSAQNVSLAARRTLYFTYVRASVSRDPNGDYRNR